MMISRREMLKVSAGTGAALFLTRFPAFAQSPSILTRTIPSSGESIPAVGLGSWVTFDVWESAAERAPLKEVLRRFREAGGTVFDTAPTYAESEKVAGALAQELGIQNELFFATKISTRHREVGVQQEKTSLRLWGRDTIDLNQVHSLRGVDIHLPTIRKAKEEGRTRYVGVTTSSLRQFEQMEQVMQSEPLDFVQLNYSLGQRQAAERLLPLAQDKGIAIMVNLPYMHGRIFQTVRGHELPEWAAEFDCKTWGQFFLKYILAHPAVTVIIPATSNPEHLVDNMAAGLGRLPDERTRRRMEEFFDALPAPQGR